MERSENESKGIYKKEARHTAFDSTLRVNSANPIPRKCVKCDTFWSCKVLFINHLQFLEYLLDYVLRLTLKQEIPLVF